MIRTFTKGTQVAVLDNNKLLYGKVVGRKENNYQLVDKKLKIHIVPSYKILCEMPKI